MLPAICIYSRNSHVRVSQVSTSEEMHSPIPRNDRYNKKLKKYYVVYEENDTDVSEDEERHERRDQEVSHSVDLLCN